MFRKNHVHYSCVSKDVCTIIFIMFAFTNSMIPIEIHSTFIIKLYAPFLTFLNIGFQQLKIIRKIFLQNYGYRYKTTFD